MPLAKESYAKNIWVTPWIKKPQVSLEEKAYARKHEMEHLKYDLELSIVKHESTIYLGITSDI